MKFEELLKKVELRKDKEIILGDIYTSDYGYIIPIAKNDNDLFICITLEYGTKRIVAHDADIKRKDFKIANLFVYVEGKYIKEI